MGGGGGGGGGHGVNRGAQLQGCDKWVGIGGVTCTRGCHCNRAQGIYLCMQLQG